MEINIQDGGSSGRKATVSSFNRLNVSAKTQPRIFYASRDEGLSFNVISDVTSATAGDYVLYIKNTSSTRNMFVQHIEFHSVNAVKWKVWKVTGTASGTDVLPGNLNLGSGIPSETETKGDGAVTGLTIDYQVGIHRTEAGGEGEMDYTDALILTPGTSIAIEYDSGTTGGCEVDCFYHFEDLKAG
jgi:hypothetical protein